MQKKIEAFQNCIDARNQRENECFRGGDDGHQKAIQDLQNGIDNCNERIDRWHTPYRPSVPEMA